MSGAAGAQEPRHQQGARQGGPRPRACTPRVMPRPVSRGTASPRQPDPHPTRRSPPPPPQVRGDGRTRQGALRCRHGRIQGRVSCLRCGIGCGGGRGGGGGRQACCRQMASAAQPIHPCASCWHSHEWVVSRAAAAVALQRRRAQQGRSRVGVGGGGGGRRGRRRVMTGARWRAGHCSSCTKFCCPDPLAAGGGPCVIFAGSFAEDLRWRVRVQS